MYKLSQRGAALFAGHRKAERVGIWGPLKESLELFEENSLKTFDPLIYLGDKGEEGVIQGDVTCLKD